jgi:hypothetical protein
MTTDFDKYVDRLWESGADRHFTNLRRLKLFTNKISYSLQIVADEVNFEDFLSLELIRDIYPPLYESIYLNGEYFYDAGLALETWGDQIHPLDKEKAKEARVAFSKELKKNVPQDKQYVFAILADLFPLFGESESRMTWRQPDEGEAESQRRIFHPRFFRQYFLFRVPPELFSQKQFNDFCASVRNAREEEAKTKFETTFAGILSEDFKRYHFMHLLEGKIRDFELPVSKGLCRGMSNRSSIWSRDAFEFQIGVRCTYQTLKRIDDRTERQQLLRQIIDDSSSALYALSVLWIIQSDKDAEPAIIEDVKALHIHAMQWMKRKYLVADAPSVFDQYKDIDPVQILFAWMRLGADAATDQKEYLRKVLTTNSSSLSKFLNSMFRVDFIDDYNALRPLMDYEELDSLIAANEDKLDATKVQQYRKRRLADQSPGRIN